MAFTDTLIDTNRRRPSLLNALQAQRDNPSSGGISIRGVGDHFSADVPDDDAYAQNLDIQSTAPGMTRGQAAGSFLSGRLGEIASNYDANEMDEATKVQKIKNAVQLEAARGRATAYNDPIVRQMQDEQFRRQMQLKQLDLQSKVLPEQIRAGAQRDTAMTTAAGREAASEGAARVRGLQRQLETLEKMRYDPLNGVRPTVRQPSSGIAGLFGGTSEAPNPAYTDLTGRIDALRRQLDDEDTGDAGSGTDDLGAILAEMKRRGTYAYP